MFRFVGAQYDNEGYFGCSAPTFTCPQILCTERKIYFKGPFEIHNRDEFQRLLEHLNSEFIQIQLIDQNGLRHASLPFATTAILEANQSEIVVERGIDLDFRHSYSNQEWLAFERLVESWCIYNSSESFHPRFWTYYNVCKESDEFSIVHEWLEWTTKREEEQPFWKTQWDGYQTYPRKNRIHILADDTNTLKEFLMAFSEEAFGPLSRAIHDLESLRKFAEDCHSGLHQLNSLEYVHFESAHNLENLTHPHFQEVFQLLRHLGLQITASQNP